MRVIITSIICSVFVFFGTSCSSPPPAPTEAGTREDRAECATTDICGRKNEHNLDVRGGAKAATRRRLKITTEQEPNRNIRPAHYGQQAPPPG